MWLTCKALKYVKYKHRLFRKYKDKNHPACTSASRNVSREVKEAKFNFERKLAENIKKDSKSFLSMFVAWKIPCNKKVRTPNL